METSTIRKYGDIFVAWSVGCQVASGIMVMIGVQTFGSSVRSKTAYTSDARSKMGSSVLLTDF